MTVEFPASTPVTEMTLEQQLAYWQHQARKHEQLAIRLSRAVDNRRLPVLDVEQARLLGMAEAFEEGAGTYLKGMLRVVHGRTPEQANQIVAGLSLSAFVTDGQTDYDAANNWLDQFGANS